MAENMKSTHYANGDSVIGFNIYNPGYYNYNNDSLFNIYCNLYHPYGALDGAGSSNTNPSGIQGVCPTGWHVPSLSEWEELAAFLGGNEMAGNKLKEAGTDHWVAPNQDATNSTGFNALPGGLYFSNVIEYELMEVGSKAYFLTTTAIPFGYGYYHARLHTEVSTMFLEEIGEANFMLSVRCVKD